MGPKVVGAVQASEREQPLDIPSGTVTFLFTDIEGSTRLLEQLREGYVAVLAGQRDLLRAAFARWNGREIDTQGDSFFAAFPRALDAVNCVVEAQRALAGYHWPQNVRVRVRMGLHTGEPLVARSGYVGMDVPRAARIAAAGHGGQVLLSQTTRDLVYQDLPPGASLRALGEHKLKDIRFPQPIYQLDLEGLPADFPALKTRAAEDTPPTPGEPPFKGLRYFDESDGDRFFGRDDLIGRLLDELCAQRFLAIIGASGSGKSSIVRAGVAPALRRSGRLRDRRPAGCEDTQWQIHLLTPTERPLEALASSLTRASESVSAAATLLDDMGGDARSLLLWVRRHMDQGAPAQAQAAARRLLVVVDQFEELFTLCRDEAERHAFVDNLLLAAGAEGGATTVAIALRADFYEHLAPYPALSEAVARHQVYIGAMKAAELREAIEAPAAHGGWEFSPGLVELLLHDVGADQDRPPEPGALPLLSHALLETWKHRRGNVMNLRAYSESGTVRGAIAHTAERVFYQELSPAQQAIARNIFLRLTELGEGTQDTRRRASYAELRLPQSQSDAQELEAVLARLADARLIITSESSVEVAHEALIREWPTLRNWLAEDREGLRLHRHLTESAQAWTERGRDPAELYRGARLAQALEWAEWSQHRLELNTLEQDFLDAARTQAEREQAEQEAAHQRELEAAQQVAAAAQQVAAAAQRAAQAEQQRAEAQAQAARQLRRRAVYLLGALVVAVAAALAALVFGQRASQSAALANQSLSTAQAAGTGEASARGTEQSAAQSNLARAEALRLASAAAGLAGPAANTELIGLLAVRSMKLQYSLPGDAMLQTAAGLDYPLRIFGGDPDPIYEVAFSPDGRLVAGSHWQPSLTQQTVSIWESGTGKLVRSLTLPNFGLPAFAPDSRTLAICWADPLNATEGTAGTWDVASGQAKQSFNGGACSSPPVWQDGRSFALAGLDNSVQLVDANTGQTLKSWSTSAAALQVSPRARYALVSPDYTPGNLGGEEELDLWNLATGAVDVTATSFSGIWGAAFSLDEAYVALGFQDGTIKIWVTATGAPAATLKGPAARVTSLAFAPDGTALLSASADGLVHVWSVANWQETQHWLGNAADINAAQFSPDGRQVVTGNGDGSARLWAVDAQPEWPALAGNGGAAVGIVFSHDNRQVVTAGTDGVARLRDIHTGQTTRSFPGAGSVNFALRLSPDGGRLLAGSLSASATLWDLATGATLWQTQAAGMDSLHDAAFAPDGQTVVLVGTSSVISETYAILDDTRTGAELRRLVVAGTQSATGVDVAPDGRSVLVATIDNNAWLLDAQTGQVLHQLKGHTAAVNQAHFSPDGRYVVTASADKTARVWEVATGQVVRTLTGHTGAVVAAAFSPNGQLIATGSRDGTVRVWDAASGQELRRFAADALAVEDVAWSPDGALLASTGDDTTAKIWDVDYHATIAYLCGRLQRDLSDAERAAYNIADATPTCRK